MRILAVDTSTLVLGIAIVDEQKVIGEKTTNLKKNHSIRLMPAIDELLQDLELSLTDIDAFAVTKGPGSYTGVRIGVTTVKTFAWGLNKPIIGVSTLVVLGMNGFYFSGLVVPLLDARRNQVYATVLQWESGEPKELLPEQIIPVNQLLDLVKQQSQDILFIGDDVGLFSTQITESLGDRAVFAPASFNRPQASNLGYLAINKWNQGNMGERADFAPNYLQLTLAEKNLLGRLT